MADYVYISVRESIFMITLFIFSILCISILGLFAIGTTLHAIRAIKTQNAFIKQPHARRWRHKPLLTVVATDIMQSMEQIRRLRRSYRKLTVNSQADTGTGFLLWLPANTTLAPDDLKYSVRQLNDHPNLRYTPLSPIITAPQNISDFFHAYLVIITFPLAEARSGLRIDLANSFTPFIVNQSVSLRTYRTYIYTTCRWLFGSLALVIFLLSFYLALVMGQPELLTAYLASFCFWCVWAIGRYPHLAITAKLRLIVLLPASLGYFLYRLMTAPVRFLTRRALPIGVS